MANFQLSPRELQRLKDSIFQSRKQLSPFIKKRKQFLDQLVGAHYRDGNDRPSVPVNLTELLVSTLRFQLSSNDPMLSVTTPFKELKPSGKTLEAAVNRCLARIKYSDTMRQVVEDAILSIGIGRVGLESGGAKIGGYDQGMPFAESISLDNFVIDMPAKRRTGVTYMGHWYDKDARSLLADPRYRIDSFTAEQLGNDSATDTNMMETGDERADSISRDKVSGYDHYRRRVPLWDIWLPQEGVILTFFANPESSNDTLVGEPIKAMEWYGHQDGPYDLLGFHVVPDQIMPLSPVAVLFDMDLAANTAYRKLFQSSKAQKDIFAYRPGASSEAERLRDAPHLSMLKMENPGDVNTMKFGGVDNGQMSWAIHLANVFKSNAGNLDLVGGLSPASETFSQDRLLGANASKRIQDMQNRVVDFAGSQMRKIAWWYFHDANLNESIIKKIPGTRRSVARNVTAADIQGDFLKYNYSLDPYSMPHRSPSERLQSLMTVWQTIIAPSLPFMNQQGIGIDWEAFIELIADYGSLNEVKDILTFTEGAPRNEEPVGMPQTTTRINERVNRSAGSGRTFEQGILERFMAGAGAQ